MPPELHRVLARDPVQVGVELINAIVVLLFPCALRVDVERLAKQIVRSTTTTQIQRDWSGRGISAGDVENRRRSVRTLWVRRPAVAHAAKPKVRSQVGLN